MILLPTQVILNLLNGSVNLGNTEEEALPTAFS
jgi:hypothetical protein